MQKINFPALRRCPAFLLLPIAAKDVQMRRNCRGEGQSRWESNTYVRVVLVLYGRSARCPPCLILLHSPSAYLFILSIRRFVDPWNCDREYVLGKNARLILLRSHSRWLNGTNVAGKTNDGANEPQRIAKLAIVNWNVKLLI